VSPLSKFFRYKAFERIFGETEDDQETLDRVEEKIKYATQSDFDRQTPITQDFWSTDSPEEFEKNKEKRPEELEKYGWLERGISYDLNEYGYREDSFHYSPASYIAIGECFTAGTGLPETMIWPSMLELEGLGKVWNLALPEAALDVTFRTLYSWLPVIQPKAVLLLENSQLGREVFVNEVSDKVGAWSPEEWKRDIVKDKVERFISRQKNMMAISELCQENKTELKIISATERHQIGMKAWQENENEMFAASRDLMHPGLHFQQAIAQRWLEEL
jgi:hypothetical protein